MKLRNDISWVLPALLLLMLIQPLTAAELKSSTVQAWNRYCQWADAKVRRELSDPKIFLIQNGLPPSKRAEVQRKLDSGEIFVGRMTGVVPPGTHFEIPNGEIHHWWGAVRLRNVTIPQLLQFLQDYNHHAGKFADVERSRIISVDGNRYRVYFRFKRSKAFVTAVFNTEQDCLYTSYGPGREFSESIATKIAEVADAGESSEHEKQPGNDSGIMWRLVSWWRYEQMGKDVVVEIESASLSRDVPWAVSIVPYLRSYIRSTPRESLESVLASIREHVK
jgi:hypothetical protein